MGHVDIETNDSQATESAGTITAFTVARYTSFEVPQLRAIALQNRDEPETLSFNHDDPTTATDALTVMSFSHHSALNLFFGRMMGEQNDVDVPAQYLNITKPDSLSTIQTHNRDNPG